MPISGRKPFSEIFEVVQRELIREAATGEEAKYKGLVNQVYVNDMPAILPERYIRKQAFVVTSADYNTGTVTVGTGTSNIIGDSTAWTAANSSNFLIQVNGSDQVFRMDFGGTTSLTFQASLGWTESSGTGKNYSLFQDRAALATDFAYMVKDSPHDPNVVYIYVNGVKTFLTPWTNEEYDRQITSTIGSIHAYTVKWTSGSPFLHIQANPDDAENLGYNYIPVITQLRELTKGTATVSGTSGTSLVLTTDASLTVSVDSSRTLYFRNDADGIGSNSIWAELTTITDSTTATLSSSQSPAIATGTGLTYTVSEISEWPVRFDDVLMYKAAWIIDPDGEQAQKWATLVADALSNELTIESKRKRGWRLAHFPGTRDGTDIRSGRR